ncbi:hypothetical protein [Methylobacterium nigriterrae]|uniref:hypothetical protein n=1 Tax=Methylobacterium nigriterrae TaxID=3127512 RepID=UPI003013262C
MMGDADKLTILVLATENAELRVQLAEAQDLLVETAIDAGHLHARRSLGGAAWLSASEMRGGRKLSVSARRLREEASNPSSLNIRT